MPLGRKVTFCRKANFGMRKPLAATSQIFFSLQNVLISSSSLFHLSIGCRRQNFFFESMFLRPRPIERRKAMAAAVRRYFGGPWLKVAAAANFCLPPPKEMKIKGEIFIKKIISTLIFKLTCNLNIYY